MIAGKEKMLYRLWKGNSPLGIQRDIGKAMKYSRREAKIPQEPWEYAV